MSAFPSIQAELRTQRWGLFVLSALAAGLVIGVLTFALQKVLPYPVMKMADSAAPWVIIAFAFGRFARSRSISVIAGITALIGEVAGYYGVAYARHGLDLSASGLAVIGAWVLIAFIAGSLFGLAGYAAFHQSGWVRNLGRAALGAAFVGEGFLFLFSLSLTSVAIVWFVIAVLITLFLARKELQQRQIWLLLTLLGLIGFGGEQLLVLLDKARSAVF